MKPRTKLILFYITNVILAVFFFSQQLSLADAKLGKEEQNIALIEEKIKRNFLNFKQAYKDKNVQKLKEIFFTSVDTEYMAKFVIGIVNDDRFLKIHKQDSAMLKAYYKYLEIYKNYLFSFYFNTIKNVEQAELNTILIQPIPASKRYKCRYSAKTILMDNNKTNYEVVYLVHKKNEQFYIFDIIAEKISIQQTQWHEFASFVRDGSGDITVTGLQKLNNLLLNKINN